MGLTLTKFATYDEIIKNIKTPEFIFIFYNIGDIHDDYISVIINIKVKNNKIIKKIV